MYIFSHQFSNFRPSILTIWYTWTGIVVIMMSVYDFRIKRCSVRLYLQLFVQSGVQHIICCVVLFGLSSSCVLCTQFCQFLWFVHYWLPLRFSLTFICLVCLRQVSCVPNVVSFSDLSILACPFDFFYRLEYESVFFLKILCK